MAQRCSVALGTSSYLHAVARCRFLKNRASPPKPGRPANIQPQAHFELNRFCVRVHRLSERGKVKLGNHLVTWDRVRGNNNKKIDDRSIDPTCSNITGV